jgi:hypothetical protein
MFARLAFSSRYVNSASSGLSRPVVAAEQMRRVPAFLNQVNHFHPSPPSSVLSEHRNKLASGSRFV